MKRTILQNRAVHKWCEESATELNNAGIGMKLFLKGLEVDHTKESMKEILRAVAKVKYNKDKTSELTTKELVDVCEEVNRMMANHGVHTPFPSNEFYRNQ